MRISAVQKVWWSFKAKIELCITVLIDKNLKNEFMNRAVDSFWKFNYDIISTDKVWINF